MSLMRSKVQRGSSLIEILVTLVILAIGILGVFALQTSSLKSNQNAYARTQATILSYDIIERMRANREALSTGAYDDPTPALTANCLTATGCNATQLAAHDIAEWQAMLQAQLPGGVGIICIDETPTDGTAALPACDDSDLPTSLYVVKTWWDEDRDGTPDQLLAISFQP